MPSTPVAHSYQLSFYAPRSGDVLLLTQPFYFWGKYGEKNEGSTHGSPYRYDSHVPLVFWGAGVKAGVHRGWVDISDLAPTAPRHRRTGGSGRAGEGGGVEVVNGAVPGGAGLTARINPVTSGGRS